MLMRRPAPKSRAKVLRMPVAERVEKHRKALRAAGLRPIQIWVPDVHSKTFVAQARRQCLLVAKSPQEQDDLAFIDSMANWDAT